MPIKERRTKILVGIFLLSNHTENEGKLAFDGVFIDKQFEQIFDLALNQKTKSTLLALIKGGELELVVENELEKHILTQKGFHEICLQFPYFRFLLDNWDKKWRILSYEIPESKRDLRDRLRREVAGWGLGPWHRSFWLTPHPIIENLKGLVKGKEEEQFIQAFEADHAFGETDVLIEKVWGKSALDKKYRELFKKWHDTLAQDKEKHTKFTSIIKEYIEIIRQDPGLPKELIGEGWIGYEAFNIFKEIRNILYA